MKTNKIKLSEIRKVSKDRPNGYEDAIFGCAVARTDEYVVLTETNYLLLRKKYPALRPGPGTEMKALLARIGIVASPTCSCNKRARVMDEKGCDWCAEHIDLIDGWLAEEAGKRRLPYFSLAGKALIHLAVRRSRKKGHIPIASLADRHDQSAPRGIPIGVRPCCPRLQN